MEEGILSRKDRGRLVGVLYDTLRNGTPYIKDIKNPNIFLRLSSLETLLRYLKYANDNILCTVDPYKNHVKREAGVILTMDGKVEIYCVSFEELDLKRIG